MKLFNLILSAIIITITSSFHLGSAVKKVTTVTYGVCNCESQQSAFKVELTLNENFTFNYFDNSDPKKVVDIKGTWSLDGKAIVLQNYQSSYAIHDKWTIDKNTKCIKSRKGLEFERLCLVKACK